MLWIAWKRLNCLLEQDEAWEWQGYDQWFQLLRGWDRSSRYEFEKLFGVLQR